MNPKGASHGGWLNNVSPVNPEPVMFFSKAWLAVLPAASFVLTNLIKGATPALILALLSPIAAFIFYSGNKISNYQSRLLVSIMIFSCVLLASVLAGALSDSSQYSTLTFINNSTVLGIRYSVITQSIYMVCSLFLLVWAASFYEHSWDRYIALGAWLFLSYGYFEWIAFWVTGVDYDFLSNRQYGLGEAGFVSEIMGNQTMYVFGKTVLRFKSLTGEASFFCLVAVPFAWWAYFTNRRILALAFLVAIFLSFSTTGYLALLFAVFLLGSLRINARVIVLAILAILVIWAFYAIPYLRNFFDELVIQKLRGDGQSGAERLSSFWDSLATYMEFPLFSKIFGIGFGSVRELANFQTLLINVGAVGLLVFAFLFLYPVTVLWSSPAAIAERGAVLISLFCLMVSVSEFSYLPQWLWLGILYRKIEFKRINQSLSSPKLTQKQIPSARHAIGR